MPHMSGEPRRGFLLVSRHLRSDDLTAHSGKPHRKGGHEGRGGGSRRPKKVQVSLSQHPSSLNIFVFFFFHFHAMQCRTGKQKGSAGGRVLGVFSRSPGVPEERRGEGC